MSLRELKREIDGLTNPNKLLFQFRNSWIKVIKNNTNQNFSFLQELEPKLKKEINQQLLFFQKILSQLNSFQFTQEKLSLLAQSLIELKLTSLNKDQLKPKLLIKKFLRDDFLNLNILIKEITQLERNLIQLQQIYQQVNSLIIQHLSLEQSLAFLEAPHRNQLQALFSLLKKQKKLLVVLGKEFLSLVREKNTFLINLNQ